MILVLSILRDATRLRLALSHGLSAAAMVTPFLAPSVAAQTPLLVSVGLGQTASDGSCFDPMPSATGRFVVFTSIGANLVPGDTNGDNDVFVRDVIAQTTQRVSVSSVGVQANGDSWGTGITPDARYVVFRSSATNLVSGAAPGGLYVHDRQTGLTTYEGAVSDSSPSSLSADGRFVAFNSVSASLVSGDTNQSSDVFIRDRQTGVLERVSVSSSGIQGNKGGSLPNPRCLSDDGRFVVFASSSTDLVPGYVPGPFIADSYLHDRQTGQTTLLHASAQGEQGNGPAGYVTISGDGRWAAFTSQATNLLPGAGGIPGDVFVRDLQTGVLEVASVSASGAVSNGHPHGVSISRDGRFVAFRSDASNLVESDADSQSDMFLRDRLTGLTWVCSETSAPWPGHSYEGYVSADGRGVAFSTSLMFSALDSNNWGDAYLYDRLHAEPWDELESGLAGDLGTPVLAAQGELKGDSTVQLAIARAAPLSLATLLAGFSSANVPFKGGVLVPMPDLRLPLALNGSGKLLLEATWPPGVPAGLQIYFQAWIADPSGPVGFTATNALKATTP
ncbi:MAG: hypothetical protein ACT4PU_09805 [Planctomycetota bacterium]